MDTQEISNGADSKKYFTIIPNMIDDSDLDPYERTLLVHYYRVGDCWEGTRTTAKKCNMSMGSVVSKRRSLAEKGWIELIEPDEDDYQSTVKIKIVDRWDDNQRKYGSDGPPRSPDEHPRSLHEHPRSLHEHPRSPDERKNNPIKNNQEKKSERAPAPDMNPSPPGANIDDYDDELDEMKTVLGQVVKENLFYGPHEQRIREGAKALLQAGHTPDEVATGFGEGETYWYVASHGSKGEKPWVKNVVGEIVTAVAWAEGKIKGLTHSNKVDRQEIFDSLVQPYARGHLKWDSLDDGQKKILKQIDEHPKRIKGLTDKLLRIRFYEAVPA